MGVKKPQSAYFQFSGERRKKIAEENPGLRVGDIQKLITAQWKELTDEEKQRYIDLAAKDKERYERERLENPVDVDAQRKRSGTAAEDGNVCLYPLGRVKRIIQSDPDVNKVSREALIAISKASELFAQFLATKSYEQTLFSNKRQIKASDVTRAIQITSVLDWLREDFPDVKKTTPAPPSKATSSGVTMTSKAKPSARDVSAFFRPNVAPNADEQAESESGAGGGDSNAESAESAADADAADEMDES